MPIMDGNEFLRQKLQNPKLEVIPTVVIAVCPTDLRYPATEIYKKPVNNGSLVKTV